MQSIKQSRNQEINWETYKHSTDRELIVSKFSNKMVQCDKNREAMATKPIGEIVQTVLSVAKSAQRITLGFSDAIKLLSNTPEEAQFCFLAEPKRGDSATHMHEVLLQAFCYEHGIYIIKVDSGRKLAHAVATSNGTLISDVTCVMIRKRSDGTMDDATPMPGSDEDVLVNFCENSWNDNDYHIVKLPELWVRWDHASRLHFKSSPHVNRLEPSRFNDSFIWN